jgi:transposase
MSRINPYSSIEKRNFENAMIHMLETDYGLLGGRRILQLLVEDTMALMEQFYPAMNRVSSGDLIWTCTADEGRKAEPGKRTEEYKTVTVKLPVVTVGDLRDRTEKKTPSNKRNAAARARDKERVARMVKAADRQGGLLTIAELSVIINRSYEVIRQYIKEWEEETGELLPLKGYRMDQGCRPTHKREIVRLYEQGVEPPDVARETRHSLKAVERYLQDYRRVKLLLKQNMSSTEISSIIGRGERVVLEYVELCRQYHPELFEHEMQSAETNDN